jgi:glucose/arabinose dehydrogenase
MRHLRSLLLPAGLIVLVTLPWLVTAQPKQHPREVSKLYGELCASCHGPTLTGGLAQSLLDDQWKFGGDDDSLARSIAQGQPAAGMPPMGNALSEQEIRAMVIFIREQAAKFAREQATFTKPDANRIVRSELHTFKFESLAIGLDVVWGVDLLPDGRLLVTEKPGRLRLIENGTLAPEPVGGVPAVWSKGQGGLLDVAVHPDYASNGWIYLSYSDPGPDDSAMTAVVRGKLKDGQFVEQQTLFKAPVELYRKGQVHFGSRFVFDKGYLYFSIGERGHKDDAQDLGRPNGKIHRIFDDGRVPDDNPFAGKAGALPTIWSYGHRNPQGLDTDPATGALYGAEHGPRGGDELNLVEKGKNYGWPVITYGMNYDGTPITNLTAKDGMEQPVTYWVPSIAVSSIAFYTGSKFPQWKGHLFLGALAGEELRRLVVENGRVTHQEVLFKGGGRVRDVVNGADGYIYVTFDGGRVARLVPAEAPATAARPD